MFPEGSDPRVREATARLAGDGVVRPVLLGSAAGDPPPGVTFLDPGRAPTLEKYADLYYQRRRSKGVTQVEAVEIARQPLYFAALMVSAVLTALCGALYASLFLYVVPDQVLSIDVSNEIAIVAMLGGAGTVLGPIVGSVVLESASEMFKNVFKEAHLLIYGVLLVVVVLFLPEGIVGTLAAFLRRRARFGGMKASTKGVAAD